MKILIFDEYYKDFLFQFYQRFPKNTSSSYHQTLKALLACDFGTGDFYSRNLASLGVPAQEVIINDSRLQKKWAQENSCDKLLYHLDNVPYLNKYIMSNWQEEILEQQITSYKPDVLFCQDIYLPSSKFLSKIKQRSKIFIVGQCARPVEFSEIKLDAFDLILSSFPHYVTRFKKLGLNSQYFRLGFEDSLLAKIKKGSKKYFVSFVGGYSKNHMQKNGAQKKFEHLALSEHVDFWGYGAKNLPSDSPILKTFHKEQVWGLDMYNILASSKIALNRHIDSAENHANNLRLYEATGVGTFLLTDFKSDLQKLFIPGKEVETYSTKEELVSKVKYYLSHNQEREKIARAGQKRTLKEHTYKLRMKELKKILEAYL